MTNSFWLKFSSVIGNSEGLKQLRLKLDFSDSIWSLLVSDRDKFIFFPVENFLTMS